MKSLNQFVCQIIDSEEKIRGTGFFIHPNGYIATCYHVVRECKGNVRVRAFGESKPIMSQVLLEAEDSDIAVLKIDKKECQYLQLSSERKLGDKIFSHGFSIKHLPTFPEGFPVESTLTGMTSLENKKIEAIVLENTEVDYGLSGAPAFNQRTGKVIGILTMKYDDGRKALVVPIERLFEKCPELESVCSDLEIYPNSGIYLNGSRPTTDPERIFGRKEDLENIENHLNDKSTLVITGLRGTGKSTLASMLVDRMGKNGKFDVIYWRKVNETTDISDIIGSFFTIIGKPVKYLEHYKISDQINLLFHELNEAAYLLIIDNFEILLDPRTDKLLESKVGFSELIEKANENCIKSKIVFTCWGSFATESGIRPFSYQVRGLDVSAGILLLKREGLNESETELKKAVELAGGHPLALILLAQLVKEGADTLFELLNNGSLWDGEVAENILNKIYNERLSEDECKLIQYVSIFRQPESTKGICAIANASEWSESKVKRVALSLTRKSLLQKNGEKYWEESLISKYAETRLSEKSKFHKFAVKYYLSLPIPEKTEKKEDLQPEIEAYYHACKAGEYDLAASFIEIFSLSRLLESFGDSRILIDMYEQILPKDHLKGKLILKEKQNHGAALGNLGLQYIYLGEFRKAIDYSQQALTIAKEISSRHGEEMALGNLGLAYRYMGYPEKAIAYYELALEIAQQIGDRLGERNHLSNLGLAYCFLYKFREAIEHLKKALIISREIDDVYAEGRDLGNLGIVYIDMREPKKAIKYFNCALEIARETKDILGEGRTLGNLGLAHIDMGEKETATRFFLESLAIGKSFGDFIIISTCEHELNKLKGPNE